MFTDNLRLFVASGKGGDGLISYKKYKYSRYGCPDGGNGGNGGSVYFIGCSAKTFLNLRRSYFAKDGENGKKNCKSGKGGESIYIEVPVGTYIYDFERSEKLGEVLYIGHCFLIVEGAKGGYGNYYLNKCGLQCDYSLLKGAASKNKNLYIILNILSDVALLGYPNVGKSSFLNVISNTKSKVGAYPFTTLHPLLGVIKFSCLNEIIVSDMPGIVRKSSSGYAMGIGFLKHLEKSRIFLHFIDASFISCRFSFLRHVLILYREMYKFNITFKFVNKILILSKVDLVNILNADVCFLGTLKKKKYCSIFFVSSVSFVGIKKLCFNLSKYFDWRRYD